MVTPATRSLLAARGLCAEVALSIDEALAQGSPDTAVAVQLVLDLRREADRLADYLCATSDAAAAPAGTGCGP